MVGILDLRHIGAPLLVEGGRRDDQDRRIDEEGRGEGEGRIGDGKAQRLAPALGVLS
jgi:hypothetical protein